MQDIKYTIEINNNDILKMGIAASIDFFCLLATRQLQFPGMVAFATGIDSPVLNSVIDTQLKDEQMYEAIKAVKDFFKPYDVPWTWQVSPLSRPANLVDVLEQHGFSLLEQSPGMYCDLTNSLPKINNEDLFIQEVPVNDNLRDWIGPIDEGFPSEKPQDGETYRKLNVALMKKVGKTLRHYVAYFQDEPVSSATLYLGQQATMLHNIATKTAFLKRGFGTALTLHMMHRAKQLGYNHCFLDASEDGFGVYRKLGFKIFCINQFYCQENS